MSTTNETPRKARMLTRLRINEVSAVDRGAGEGVKIVLMKRADDEPRSKGPLERAERAERIERRRREREEFEKTWGRDGPRLFNDFIKADQPTDKTPPPVDPVIADVVDRHHGRGVEFDLADGTHLTFRSEGALARWLAVQERIRKSNQEESTAMTSVERLEAERIAKFKSLNPVAVAKVLIDDGKSYGIDEHEFTALVTAHAQREHPDMTPEAAFAKVFTAQTEQGALLRKAHAVTKDLMSLEPVFVGGADARDVNSAQKAYEQLMNMAEEQRARAPWKTVAQLFSEVMQDPKNAELAAKAHQRPTATTQYPFPRT
jgi:hypothetical protein